MTVDPDQEGAPGSPAPATNASAGGVSTAPAGAPGALGQKLGGDLPCVVCRYNLRGLSIRSVCPECGTAVRATILALVDPHAAELERIPNPRLTALGLMAWVFFALAAVVACWIPAGWGGYELRHVWVVFAVIASGLGALALVRPHGGATRIATVMAGVAVFLYAPLAWLVWEVTSRQWTGGQSAIFPYVVLVAHERSPTMNRVMICILASAIALLLRPNARLLVARSLALRTGRVDRQTMLAIVAAAGIAALGEGALEYSRSTRGMAADVSRLTGQILIPAGWSLVTLGLIGSLIDAVRIAKSIVMPAPSLKQVIAGRGEGEGALSPRHGGTDEDR